MTSSAVRHWRKKIGPGAQITLPVELMRSLGVDKGDSLYLLLEEGRAVIVPERAVAPLLEAALAKAGALRPPMHQSSPKAVRSRKPS